MSGELYLSLFILITAQYEFLAIDSNKLLHLIVEGSQLFLYEFCHSKSTLEAPVLNFEIKSLSVISAESSFSGPK